MIIYNGTKSQFIKDFDDDLLIRTIRENLLKKLGRHTGTIMAEFTSLYVCRSG